MLLAQVHESTQNQNGIRVKLRTLVLNRTHVKRLASQLLLECSHDIVHVLIRDHCPSLSSQSATTVSHQLVLHYDVQTNQRLEELPLIMRQSRGDLGKDRP